jgi:DNA polymerase-3 subunit epsilon
MSWHDSPMIAFDLETTGVDPESDRIVSAAVVLIEPGSEPGVVTWLVDPGIEIPAGAAAVHGITTERVRNEGQPAHVAVGEIADLLTVHWANGLPVVGFNLTYDLTLLDREQRRHGRPPLEPGPVVDAFVLDKHVSYRRGSRKLVDQCQHYGVRIDAAHDAAADALAAARVAWRIAQQYPTVGGKTLDELHAAQEVWAEQQASSFREYLIKQGKTENLPDGQWPLRAWAAQTELGAA